MDKKYPRFPLFVDLVGKKIVVVGGGRVASRRIQALLPFGGDIIVISPQWDSPIEGVTWEKRIYQKGDLAGATLAVAATHCRAVNKAVGEEGAIASIPVSVADDPEASTFYFPALCHGGGVVVGLVSREGNDHHQVAAMATIIRNTLEQEGGEDEG